MFRRRNSMQASLTLALAVAVAGIMISSLPGVHSKGSKGKAKVGECMQHTLTPQPRTRSCLPTKLVVGGIV